PLRHRPGARSGPPAARGGARERPRLRQPPPPRLADHRGSRLAGRAGGGRRRTGPGHRRSRLPRRDPLKYQSLASVSIRPAAVRRIGGTRTKDRHMTKLLWIVQVLLAALFLFAGGMKLIMPLEALAHQSPLPALFLKF